MGLPAAGRFCIALRASRQSRLLTKKLANQLLTKKSDKSTNPPKNEKGE